METLEFVMQTDLATALPAVLEFNFEDLKKALAERMELYRGLVVTEDGIKAAKQDRADLNKLREAIEAKRKGEIDDFVFYDVSLDYLAASLQSL